MPKLMLATSAKSNELNNKSSDPWRLNWGMSQADHAYRPSMAEVLQDREGQSGLLHVLGISLKSKQNKGQEGAA